MKKEQEKQIDTSSFGHIIENDAKEAIKDDRNGTDDIFRKEYLSMDEAQTSILSEKIKDLRHYRELRKGIADKVFWYLVAWSALLFVLLFFDGFCFSFGIDPVVLATLCGGTTASAIGLVGFIVKGLFGNTKSERDKKEGS